MHEFVSKDTFLEREVFFNEFLSMTLTTMHVYFNV